GRGGCHPPAERGSLLGGIGRRHCSSVLLLLVLFFLGLFLGVADLLVELGFLLAALGDGLLHRLLLFLDRLGIRLLLLLRGHGLLLGRSGGRDGAGCNGGRRSSGGRSFRGRRRGSSGLRVGIGLGW